MTNKIKARIDRFNKEKAKIEATGLLVLPSVNGPYIWNPKTNKYVRMFYC